MVTKKPPPGEATPPLTEYGYVISDTGTYLTHLTGHDGNHPVLVAQSPPQPPKGRPSLRDWRDVLAWLVARVARDGALPDGHGAKAQVGRWIQEWFATNTDNEPSETEVKDLVSQIFQEVDKGR